jgi:hypothetical protein
LCAAEHRGIDAAFPGVIGLVIGSVSYGPAFGPLPCSPSPMHKAMNLVEMSRGRANAVTSSSAYGSHSRRSPWRCSRARSHGSILDWTPGRVAYLAAALMGGTLLIAAVATAVFAAAPYFPAAWCWTTWAGEISATFGVYRPSILPRMVGELPAWVLPIAFMAYLPVGMLAGCGGGLGVPAAVAAAAPVVALGVLRCARAVELEPAFLYRYQRLTRE